MHVCVHAYDFPGSMSWGFGNNSFMQCVNGLCSDLKMEQFYHHFDSNYCKKKKKRNRTNETFKWPVLIKNKITIKSNFFLEVFFKKHDDLNSY